MQRFLHPALTKAVLSDARTRPNDGHHSLKSRHPISVIVTSGATPQNHSATSHGLGNARTKH
ncbi:hypothetical protein [Xanthomonas campestris]|uniref:hypothetical protein n=1 Tax=Xanthomonas campestris TaxID=339 RepID=UPI0032E4E498